MRDSALLGLLAAMAAAVACGGRDEVDTSLYGSPHDGGDGTGGASTGGRSSETGGVPNASGGALSSGGTMSSGGRMGSGGATSSGGTMGSGGRMGSGGTTGSGGSGGVPEASVDSAAGGAREDGGPIDAAVDGDFGDATVDDGSFDAAASDGSSLDAGTATPEAGSVDGGLDRFAVDLDFDEGRGENTYFGLDSNNWSGDPTYVMPHSGTEAILSANGNATGTFAGIGFTKVLGGTIENRPYQVSFWVVQYFPGMSGIELSDFTVLRIGGPDGTMTWTNTPVPDIADEWVQWTGTYTPAPSDVGQPFRFEALFNLDGRHSIGIDGPIVAVPL